MVARRGWNSALGLLGLVLFGLLLSLLLIEIALQVYSYLVVYPQLDELLANRRHYLVQSEDPVLGFELAPSIRIEAEGRVLVTNRYGLREESDSTFEGRTKLALLGDSVVMSHGHSQDETLDALLERYLASRGHEVVVLNFGVGGYGFSELARFLELKNEVYHVDHVLYLLNPNDYTRRDTLYEGADNGTYRLYHRPLLKTPWFLGKAIYRYQKRGSRASVSTRWYRWLYRGNAEFGFRTISWMSSYCRQQGCTLSVALLPAGVAFGEQGYELSDMYDEIASVLLEAGIPVLSPIQQFGRDPARYFDNTDHLTGAGNAFMAELLGEFVRERRLAAH